MRKIIFISLFLIMITGCKVLLLGEKYHAFDYEVVSNSDCLLSCEKTMNDYECTEAKPSTMNIIKNGEIEYFCTCYIRNCNK